jgi:hypothetical protein
MAWSVGVFITYIRMRSLYLRMGCSPCPSAQCIRRDTHGSVRHILPLKCRRVVKPDFHSHIASDQIENQPIILNHLFLLSLTVEMTAFRDHYLSFSNNRASNWWLFAIKKMKDLLSFLSLDQWGMIWSREVLHFLSSVNSINWSEDLDSHFWSNQICEHHIRRFATMNSIKCKKIRMTESMGRIEDFSILQLSRWESLQHEVPDETETTECIFWICHQRQHLFVEMKAARRNSGRRYRPIDWDNAIRGMRWSASTEDLQQKEIDESTLKNIKMDHLPVLVSVRVLRESFVRNPRPIAEWLWCFWNSGRWLKLSGRFWFAWSGSQVMILPNSSFGSFFKNISHKTTDFNLISWIPHVLRFHVPTFGRLELLQMTTKNRNTSMVSQT